MAPLHVSRRTLLVGTASAAIIAGSGGQKVRAAGASPDAESKKLLTRAIKVAFPHSRFPDGCYERTTEAIFAAAAKTPGQSILLSSGLAELKAAGFDGLDDAAALAHLKGIESTPFFQLVRGTTVTTLYNDHEVWQILGYEGASFDKGGYINRGFNDLDWLPEARITEG